LTAGAAAGAAREKVEDRGVRVMNQGKLKAGQIYHHANRNRNEQYERVIGHGSRNPGKATLIAFGAGVDVELLVAGGFSALSRHNRLVELVTNALSALTYNQVR